MKQVERYSRKLRTLLSKENIENWSTARDKKQFCLSLVDNPIHSDIEKKILSETLNSLIKKKADDRFSEYKVGDKVSILQRGKRYPATITGQHCKDSLAVAPHQPLPQSKTGEQALTFKRAREQVFTRMDGKEFSRICPTPLLRNKALLIK